MYGLHMSIKVMNDLNDTNMTTIHHAVNDPNSPDAVPGSYRVNPDKYDRATQLISVGGILGTAWGAGQVLMETKGDRTITARGLNVLIARSAIVYSVKGM